MPSILNSKGTLDFLGTIGTVDRGDNVTLNHTARALVDLSDFLIDQARNNLDRGGNVATGETGQSMKAVNILLKGAVMSLDIELLSTYKFLDLGVKGTHGGAGKFQFKNSFPNDKMAKAIRSWLRTRRVVTKYKAKSKTERKNKKINKMVQSQDNRLTSLSYAIATNIKKKGIKATKFFSKAIEATRKEQKKKYGDALKLDIIESINRN